MYVLIIEDDAELAAAIAGYLELHGVECDFAYHGQSGLDMALKMNFDIIILDLMLPRINGIELCRLLRQQACQTPILMLTACDTNEEQLEGFNAGSDDYVIKPCPMPLLWARLQAMQRRVNPLIEKLSLGSLHMYFQEHRVTREEQEIKLTPTGWKLLELLLRKTPNIVSRSELENFAWPDSEVDSGNFNVQLHQLRKAVDKPFAFPLIHTQVGVGLYLREEP